MSEELREAADLKAQYTAQVAADLERNAKEQELIGAQITALQGQLDALRQDQALLASMQQALRAGTDTPGSQEPDTGGEAAAQVPQPRSATPRAGSRKKAAAKGKKAVPSSAAAPKASKASTLGELILNHLAQQDEPRSAAEVTDALTEAHSQRGIKAKVVRVTLESLVAKGRVDRTKQGRSVFYSLTDTTTKTSSAAPGASAQTTAAAEDTVSEAAQEADA